MAATKEMRPIWQTRYSYYLRPRAHRCYCTSELWGELVINNFAPLFRLAPEGDPIRASLSLRCVGKSYDTVEVMPRL